MGVGTSNYVFNQIGQTEFKNMTYEGIHMSSKILQKQETNLQLQYNYNI